MTQIFDKFKQYHNANYHGGDSHFDAKIYKKSNGDDFDCMFVQDCYDHFEAGAESQQKEVDKLHAEVEEMEFRLAEMKSRLNDTYTEGQTSMYITKQTEIDDLQKRIAVYEKHVNAIKNIHENEFDMNSDTSWILGNLDGFFECLYSDLKGEQND